MPPAMKATILLLFSAAAVFAQSPDKVPEGLASSDWGSIRAAYEAGRHEVRAVVGEKGVFEGKNPGQQWRTRFDGRGFTATPSSGGWTWGLELESYGWAGAEQAVTGTPRANASGTRFTYDWSDSMQEWYLNDQRGLEHGFFIKKRPTSGNEAELSFKMKVRGGLRPEISGDARAVNFLDANGATVLNYGGLKVWDADEKPLPARFEATSDGGFRFLVDEKGARYPITIDPVAQQAYLKASNAGAGDQFGSSMSVSGNTVVISAPGEASSTTGTAPTSAAANEAAENSGAVYVFVRNAAGTWSQQAYLKASNTGAGVYGQGDRFGVSVAISGDTIVVGAPSEESTAIGIGGNQANNGAPQAGAAYVFIRSGGTWSQQAYLKASNTDWSDAFGYAVAISGDTVVVGAIGEASGVVGNQANNSAPNAGAAYVFTRSGITWSQQAYLKASNTGAGDFFGGSIAISGDTVVVSASWEGSNATGVNATLTGASGTQSDNSAPDAGAAYVFTRSGSAWSQQAYLKASNTDAGDHFGISLAISGETVVVGAYREDSSATGADGNQTHNSATDAGAAYVFTRSGSTWSQQTYLKASNTGAGDEFGVSVAISGNTLVVGAWGESSNAMGADGNQTDNSAPGAGAAYVFTRTGIVPTWSQQTYLKASNTGVNDRFGNSIAISGSTVVVGAYAEDSSATGVNAPIPPATGNQSDNSAWFAGAAYTFLFSPNPPSVITRAATGVTSSGAVLNSTVYAGFSATSTGFSYRLSNPSAPPAWIALPGVPASVSGNFATAVSTTPLSGLLPGRTYEFFANGVNGAGGAAGNLVTFTTAPAAPTAITLAASSITSTTAVLHGIVSANGEAADAYFRYFSPGVAGVNVPASPALVTTQSTPVSLTVTGLLPGTAYTFAARAVNSVGEATWLNQFFTTLPDPTVGGLAEALNVPVAGGSLYGSAIQPDGKTLIFGDFTSVHGTPQGRMARLNPDGTLETGLGFNPGANGDIICAAVLADGKILIGGNFTTLQPRGTGTVFTRNRLARLLSDGTVDTTFGDPGVNAYVLSMAVQPDGAVLVGGDFTSFMSTTRNRIARITAAGAIDANFNPNSNGPVYGIASLLDGRVLLGGNFSQMSGISRSSIARVNGATGVADPTYTAAVNAEVFSIAQQRDGKAILGGAFTTANSVVRSKLARLNADGTLDATFNPNVTGGNVFSIALQANQKMILGGSFTNVGGLARNKVARVDNAGVLDGFNPNVSGGDVRSIALQADGKAQLGGTFTGINGGAATRPAYALLNNETAYQTLEKRSATEIYWSRGGSAPEVLSVAFDYATIIGTVFSPIGNGSRVDPAAGDWRHFASPALPLVGQLRARARTASGYLSGSTGIMESKASYIHALPTVTTTSVNSITGTSARLRGSVSTSTLAAVPAFKLDVTTAYTQPLRIATPASITGTANFSFDVTGLTPGTSYVFRATAENVGGRADGVDITFTTLANLQVDYNAGGSDNAPTVTSYVATGRQVNFTLARPLVSGTTLRVVNNTGGTSIEGTFDNLAQNQEVNLTFGGVTYPYVAHYFGGDGNDLVLLWRNTRILTWGWNNLGQLGNRSQTNRGIPGDINPSFLDGKTIVSLSGGFQHSVALCSDGTVASWGDNGEGQLGIGEAFMFIDFLDHPMRVQEEIMQEGVQAIAVSAGRSHTLALYSSGMVYAWGDNEFGQLGNGAAPADSALPTLVRGALEFKQVVGISAGEYHNLAVCDDGSVAVWGRGANGRLGNGSLVDQNSPVLLDLSDFPFGAGEKIVEVAAGRSHSMARTNLGKVITWGLNSEGQLGLGTTTDALSPQQIPGLIATRIYGGGTYHSLALSDDKLVAWGTNVFGQLGTGAFVNSFTPVQVNTTWLGGQSLTAAVSGDEHNLALRTDGTLYSWGLGNEGRLGDGDTTVHSQPGQIPVNALMLDPGDRWQGIYSGSVAQHSLGILAVSITPTIRTHEAVVYSGTEALITAIVNPHGRTSDVIFSYGLTPSYGTTVAADPTSFNGVTPRITGAVLTGLLPGRTYHYSAFLTQPGPGGASVFGEDRTFTTYTRLQIWRFDNFDTFENTGDAADSADPENDGISNLLEFALGLDPKAHSQLPPLVRNGVNYSFEFAQPMSSMGVTYRAEWSPTMNPDSWLPLTDTGAGLNHIFTLNSTGLPRAFMRLRVTAP